MSTEEEVVALEDQTKAELQDIAEEKGVDWSDSDTKAELIDKIHAADVEAGDVPDESEVDAPVSSYPGSTPSEMEPGRRPMDVDIANIEDPDAEYEGETSMPLNAESWVILDGDHDGVPDGFDGAVAAVLSFPTVTETDLDTGEQKTYFPPEGIVTVRERSQGLTLALPLEAFKEIHTNGRPSVLGFA